MSSLSTTDTVLVARPRVSSATKQRYVSVDVRSVTVAVAFGVLVFGLAWYRHFSYHSHTFDLVQYDQAIWLMAHGHAPFASNIGVNIFRAHLAPVLVVFVPFYLVAATPVWLLAAQSAAIGFGVLTLGPLLDALNVPRTWRLAFILAYMASPAIWSAALFDFHVSTLAVPLLFAGILAALRDDVRRLAIFGVAILLIRDGLGLAVIGLALVGCTKSSRPRQRVAIAVLAFVWFVVGGWYGQHVKSPAIWSAHYGYLGSDPSVALHHPGRTLWRAGRMVLSGGNGITALWWVMPLAFLPLLAPGLSALGALWLVPVLPSATLSAGVLAYYYGAPVLPFLLLAAATAVRRIRHRFLLSAGPVLLAAFALASLWSLNPIGRWMFGKPAPPRGVADQALRYIEPTDSVTATETLGPHLAHRSVLLPFPYPFMAGDDASPLDSSVTRIGHPFVDRIDAVAIFMGADASSLGVRRAFLESPYLKDFRLVFARGGLLIYRRHELSPG
jgi:uncharacterized membrane protein